MRVFISWSGARSQVVATALRDWLPDVIQGVDAWLSASDIEAGSRWSRSVEEALSQSRVGVLCITPENQAAPWVLFEAGALAKTIEDTYVCPYLIDLEPPALAHGPLTLFQAKTATERGTFDLVRAINRAMKEDALSEEKVERAFRRWWPDLELILQNLPGAPEPIPKPTREDVLDEIVLSTREILRRLAPVARVTAMEELLQRIAAERGGGPSSDPGVSLYEQMTNEDVAELQGYGIDPTPTIEAVTKLVRDRMAEFAKRPAEAPKSRQNPRKPPVKRK